MSLDFLDWVVIAAYMVGMVGLSLYLRRGQKSQRDYFLGGNTTGPLPIALSTMATQSSTNSMLGIPAFVGFTAYGGLVWLQGEVALPFAMIFLMVFLFPVFRSLNLISIYGYLETRFGVGTRTVASLLFQIVRALATGVTVYGISLVLQHILNVPFWMAVLLLGTITIVYDTIGGMKAVIWSDVIQMIIIFGTVFIAIGVALNKIGGVGEALELFDHNRLRGLDLSGHGFGDGHTYAFLPSFFGIIFLSISYYGCDQTQAQRELATRNVDDTNMALFLGGLLRFPLILSYCVLGLCIGAYAAAHPEFLNSIPATDTGAVAPEPNFNLAVPVFVSQNFPHGLIGLVVVGLFAAAMSSLDSALNSLSAASMQDILPRFLKNEITQRQELVFSKLLTVFWGGVCLSFAFVVGDISATVVESINKIGSILYGPTLALFVMGVLSRRTNGPGVVGGLIAGILCNLCLWRFQPDVSWLWWNVTGFAASCISGYILSLFYPAPVPEKLEKTLFRSRPKVEGDSSKFRRNWRPFYWLLFVYGVGLLIFLALLPG